MLLFARLFDLGNEFVSSWRGLILFFSSLMW